MYSMPSPTAYPGFNQYYPGFTGGATPAAGAPAATGAVSPGGDPNAAANWGAQYPYWGGKCS